MHISPQTKFQNFSLDKVEQLLTLYQSALQPETVNQATTELINLYENPETVFDHIFFVDQCNNLIIKRYVILKLPTLIKGHLLNFSEEQIANIKESIFRLILQEQDLNCRYFLCDTLASIMKKYTKLLLGNSNETSSILIHYTQIFNFGNETLKTPNLLSTGLYLWRDIFIFFQDFGLIPSEEDEDEDSQIILNLLFTLLSILPTSISSENEEDRIQSLQLLEIFHDFLIEIDDINESQQNLINSLFQSLQHEYETSINGSTIELTHFCSTISSYIENPPSFLDDSILSSFFELTVTFLSNTTNPIEKRIVVYTILESSVDLITSNDGYKSEISNFVNLSISMSIEICEHDRTDTNYEFPYQFFYLLSDAFNDSEPNGVAVFDLFMSFSSNLAENQNFVAKQVSLFVVKSIIESLQEIISMKIDDIVHFIITVGDTNDEFVLNSACQTINELFEYKSSSASKYIDEITSFLTKYATCPICIQTLDSIFYRSDSPPTNIESIFKGLTEMISIESSNYQIESLLSCITSLFSRLSNTEEEILASFLPFINQIISSPSHFDLHSSVLDFFGRIVNVAPITIKSELHSLVPFAIESFSMANFELNIASSFCLRAIAKYLPVSFSPYLAQAVPPLIATLQRSDEDEIDETDEILISGVAKAQREAMLTLATFVGYCPLEMSEYAQSPVLEFIESENGGLSRHLVYACESLAYAAEGCKILGIKLFDVIKKIVPSLLLESTEKDHVFSILMLMAEIVAVFGDVMTDDVIELIIKTLISILSSPPPSFLLSETASSSFDPQIQRPFFFLFAQAIDMFNEDKFESLFGHIVKILISYLQNESKSVILRCNAINVAAHFCSSCGRLASNAGNFYQIVQNSAIQVIMSSQSIEANLLIAKAMKFLIMADKSQMQSRLEMIFQFAYEIIEKCEYFGLFCTLLMAYKENIVIKEHLDRILKFVESLPPLPDSEDVVFYSEFVVFLLNSGLEIEELQPKLPEVASSLFASSDKHFQKASVDIKTIFASIISKLSEDDLIALNKADESKLVRITNHMKLADS